MGIWVSCNALKRIAQASESKIDIYTFLAHPLKPKRWRQLQHCLIKSNMYQFSLIFMYLKIRRNRHKCHRQHFHHWFASRRNERLYPSRKPLILSRRTYLQIVHSSQSHSSEWFVFCHHSPHGAPVNNRTYEAHTIYIAAATQNIGSKFDKKGQSND